ncbi:putative HTH-type transcriptional regulator YjiR [Delftia sp. K82]|uniref:aminotransferase-like domain-containing protein n=1 Tax=Delftia sp. K82 TaxID=1472718 RepID=UPI000B495972|nr:PLP-dependent aminotransferase family protein [Delftia sp. K82]OWG19163.1 putative HTH-type transcriptional regulator YjiR [Delftia sp. K82]
MPQARYKQLVDRLAADIRQGRLKPGTVLPTHRQLAAEEGISLATATRTYAELQAMGLVAGEVGRGTFVREPLPLGQDAEMHVASGDLVDLTFNYPALPAQTEALRTALRQLASAGELDSLLRYQPHGGRPHERAVVAEHLKSRGLAVSADTVLIVSGAIHGLATVAMSLLQPGDVLAVDALSYPGIKVVAEQCRLELVAIPAAGMGPDLDALEALCRSRRVRAVYCMPTLHNPLGWVMPPSQRHALIDLARRHGLLLVEDGTYAFLEKRAPPALAALAPDITVHVSSLSKSVAAGLRFGFVSAPPALIPRINRAIRATVWNTPSLVTSIACQWLQDGTVARLERDKRRDASARQAIAGRVLSQFRTVGHPASYFIWMPMPQEVRADAVAMRLREENILVSTSQPYAMTSQPPHAIRLALGSVSHASLQQALEVVARVVGNLGY